MLEKEIFKRSTRTIIGIGINLNIKKEESWWGDLSKYKLETKRNRLINLIISEIIKLEHNYDWINEWRSGCIHLNREVEIYPIFDQKSIGASKLIDNFTRMLSKFLVRIFLYFCLHIKI